jgi:protocatechuate 3,4-dioxygenase beta subunit
MYAHLQSIVQIMSQSKIPHPKTFLSAERLERIRGYFTHENRTPDRDALVLTPEQTTGPFFPAQLLAPGDDDLARRSPNGPAPQGQPIIVTGRITDIQGRPIPGALIEAWQANVHGKYDHPADITSNPVDPHFKGYGRILTNSQGEYRFTSIKPGAYPNPGYDEWFRPPHIHFSVFGAGVMQRLITQMYFPDEPLNEIDPILNGIEDLAARASLIAVRESDAPDGSWCYRFDLRMRGEGETQFFVER